MLLFQSSKPNQNGSSTANRSQSCTAYLVMAQEKFVQVVGIALAFVLALVVVLAARRIAKAPERK